MKTLLGYLDILADFYESPSLGVRETVERAPLGLGVLCFLLSGATLSVAQALKGGGSMWLFRLLPLAAVLMLAALLPLITGFLLAGILHLTAEVLGAERGTAKGLFVLLGMSQCLYLLYLPVILTTQVLTANPGSWRAAALAALAMGSLALKLAGIKANYGFSTVRAGAVLLLPVLTALLLLVGGVGYMVGSALSLGHLLE